MDVTLGNMQMGGMSMGEGVPTAAYMQKMYWAVVGAAIATSTLVNVLNNALAEQRLRSKAAKPTSTFWTSYATATAICREISHASIGSLRIKSLRVRFPSLGKVVVLSSNLVVVLVLCFYKLNTLDQWKWEDIGYRTGFIALSQLPLIFLLAAKDNVIGCLIGVGYEKLNWLHRWTARTLWLTVTVHMGFWFRSWARYDYIKVKMAGDPITRRGFAAWCILTFIVATSFAPVRRTNYEVFIITHIVTFAGFIGAVYIHVPSEVKAWVWVSIGLFFLDRLLRLRRVLYLNHFQWRSKTAARLWSNQARLTRLPGNVTRITIDKPAVSWKPGQHMFLSCHSIVPLQSHPFTISSLPCDGAMEFLVQAREGGTKRFMKYASSHLPTAEHGLSSLKHVGIEGPYGRLRPLNQFDSVVLFAGGTGATFTVALMRDVVKSWCLKDRHAGRRIRFVWVIKSREQLAWFNDKLEQVVVDVDAMRVADLSCANAVDLSIYVTCDEQLVAEKSESKARSPPILQGEVKEVSSRLLFASSHIGEGKQDDGSDVASTISFGAEDASSRDRCGLDGGCCSNRIVKDEADAAICMCSPHPPMIPTRSGVETTLSCEAEKASDRSLSTTYIKVLGGRPHPRSIIREVLEEAEGESAVVVCGPLGLADDVRDSVVALSDERAVHKGTGAQGIYLHIEEFSY